MRAAQKEGHDRQSRDIGNERPRQGCKAEPGVHNNSISEGLFATNIEQRVCVPLLGRELTKVVVEMDSAAAGGAMPAMSWERISIMSHVPEDPEVAEVSVRHLCLQVYLCDVLSPASLFKLEQARSFSFHACAGWICAIAK